MGCETLPCDLGQHLVCVARIALYLIQGIRDDLLPIACFLQQRFGTLKEIGTEHPYQRVPSHGFALS